MTKYILHLFLLLVITVNTLEAQIKFTDKPQSLNLINNTNDGMGYEYYLAVAPNEAKGFPNQYSTLSVFLSSLDTTNVDYYYAGKHIGSFTLIPYVTKVIELEADTCEIREEAKATNKTYRFKSSAAPISAYFFSSKSVSTEGMKLVPVNLYGKEYIHNSYWENGEYAYLYFKSGFLIVAAYDGTVCKISLKGRDSSNWSYTEDRRKIGEEWTVLLNKGECYRVATNAYSRGLFDISGTKISANQPFGMISYHERAEIPRLAPISSRNHLLEMLPPTRAWSKEYYSMEFTNTGQGGDLFRIMCKDDDTRYEVLRYNHINGKLISKMKGTLLKSGDFVEFPDNPVKRDSNFIPAKGVAVYRANKPIQVFQYSFSSAWDGGLHDPMYTSLPSQESFTKDAVFQIPPNYSFEFNHVNLFIKGDTLNPENNTKLLSSLKMIYKFQGKLDSEFVYERYPQFLNNRIPGTDIYWCKLIDFQGSVFRLKSETPFGAYVYGLSYVDGYSCPATSFKLLPLEKDTIAPKLNIISNKCGKILLQCTELYVDSLNNDPDYVRQVDSGISVEPTLLAGSYNVEIKYPNGKPNFDSAQKDFIFELNCLNLNKDYQANLRIIDNYGNVLFDTIRYKSLALAISPDTIIHFGQNQKINEYKDKKVTIYNNSKNSIEIFGIYILNNQNNQSGKTFELYKGFSPKKDTSFLFAPGDSISLIVRFNAIHANILESDSLRIVVNCENSIDFPIYGKAIAPKIFVSDCNFGQVLIGSTKKSSDSIFIENIGEDTLSVSGFSFKNDSINNFSINSSAKPVVFPITLLPKSKFILNDFVSFKPNSLVEYNCQIKFIHNGDSFADEVAICKGLGVNSSTVDDGERERDFTISPNPINGDIFFINMKEQTDGVIDYLSIVDESGRTIKTYENLKIVGGRIEVIISNMISGNYIIKFKIDKIIKQSKIVISK